MDHDSMKAAAKSRIYCCVDTLEGDTETIMVVDGHVRRQ